MTAAELVERGQHAVGHAMPRRLFNSSIRPERQKIARAAIAETLAVILDDPPRGPRSGYSLRATLEELATEIREQSK